VKRLDLTDIARADLASIRRYSSRAWGRDQTVTYVNALRETFKALARDTVAGRARDVFERDESRVLVVRVLHDRMDYRRHLGSLD
jgi:plasmid stabilization system protein ParE